MRIFSVLFLFFAMRKCHLSSYKVRLRIPFAHSEAFFPIPFKNSCKKTRIEFFYSPLFFQGLFQGGFLVHLLHSSLCTKLIPKILHSAQMIFNGNALTIKVGYVIMLLDEDAPSSGTTISAEKVYSASELLEMNNSRQGGYI